MTVTPRILFVHAHPDDETITTGGTIAAAVAEGAQVTVLSATRGEGGEVIPPELRHLEGDRPGLAAVREREIAEAMAALGVRDHRFLGQGLSGGAVGDLPERRFEDSGMEWGPDGHARAASDMTEQALCRADLSVTTAYIAEVIDEIRPHAIVTYAANGGYGHPDHVRVHEATVAAATLIASWKAGRLLYVDVPAEVARSVFDPSQPGFTATGFSAAATIPTMPPVGDIVIAQDISGSRAAKRAALAAHRTQVAVSGEFFALSNDVGMRIADHEYYSIGAGVPAPLPAVPAAGGVTGQGETYAPHILSGLDLDTIDAENYANFAPPTELRRRRQPRKPGVLAYVHAVLLGGLIGFLGAMQHLNVTVIDIGSTPVILPWGVVLALLLTACGLWHLKSMYRSSAPMLCAAFVVACMSYLLGQPQWLPGSDLVVTGTLRSVAWLLGPMVLAAIFAFVKVPRR